MDFPKFLQLETTVSCNAECTICPNQFITRDDMPTEHIYNILSQLRNEPLMKSINPFFTNEPFMDKRMWDIIEYCRDEIPHAQVEFYSNMSLLTERLSERLLSYPNFKYIAFSLDGATEEVFNVARYPLKWDKVKRNCDTFLELRKKMNRNDVHVKVVMTATPQNQQDVPAFKEMWKDRVDEIMVFGSDSRAFLGSNIRKAREAGKLGLFNNDPRWPCRNHKCHQHSMYILSNGDVTPCCKDWNSQTVLGNAFETPLREIWHSDRFNQLREKLDQGIYDEKACALCPMMG